MSKNRRWWRSLCKVILILLTAIFCFTVSSCSHSSNLSTEEYQYDNKGRLICRTTPDGSKIKYKYNQQGLPIEISYPDDPVRYGYDANGNRIWVQNKNGKTEYKYDAFDRVIEVIFKYSPEKRITYEYDPWNRISAIKILDGQNVNYQVKYEYNILGNLVSVDDGNGRIEYSYFPDKGEIVRHLPNGIRSIFTYSPSGGLTSLKHISTNNNLIASYRYEYNPAGKLSSLLEETIEGIKITKYEWDNRGYLKTLHLPDGNSISYEYDSMGNRLSVSNSIGAVTYKYDNLGRLTKAGDTKYEWDANGNLLTQIDKDSKTRFKYDAKNLPLLVKTPDITIRYSWDGDGNMIAQWKGKDPTYYLPNPLAPSGFTLAEFDKTGRINTAYLYSDALLGQRDMSGMKYFLEDGFNSIRHIVDMNGKIIGQKDYSPFGEPITVKGDMAGNFRMMGERFLPETKSYVIGGRLYEPKLGWYLTPDPIAGYMERFDSFNKYAHGSKSPNIFMEPLVVQNKKIISTYALISPNLGNYGLYNPIQHPFRMLWHFGKIPFGGIISDASKVFLDELFSEKYSKFFRREAFDVTLPVSVSYLIGGQIASITSGTWSLRLLFSFPSVGLHQAPLVFLPLLQGVLHSYWSFVFRTFEEADRQSQEATLRSYFPPDMYNVTQSRNGNKLTTTIQTRGFPLLPQLVPLSSRFEKFRIYQEKRFNQLEEQGKRQATVAAGADRKKYKDDQKKPLLEEGQKKALDIRTKRRRDEYPPFFPPPPPGCPPFCDDGGGGLGGIGRSLGNRFQPPPPGCPPFCCPPFCDDGGGGGPGGPGGGGPGGGPGGPFDGRFDGPFKSIEAKLGGIKLDATAQFTGNLGNITGAVYDPDKQVLVLVGDENVSLPFIRPEDLAVALISVFGSNHILPQDPQFSLDPADPKNPRGKWLRAVYIPEQIIGGTEFGKALFEADWLLKQYSFGVTLDAEGKMYERKSSVTGFKSTADLSYDEKDRGPQKERWNRFWIVSEEMKLRQSGKCIYFDSARMRVKSKKQVPDQNSRTGLSDVDSEDDLVAKKFAKGFTDLYDEIAKESPEFERVRQLAKAVAIAKWMKQEGIPFDTRWVNEYANKRVDTVGRITALSTQWEKSNQTPFQRGNQSGILTQIHKIHLFGGVDLTVKPKYVSDNGTAQGLQKAVTANLRGKVIEPTFDVNCNGKSYHAVVLPVTHKGQAIWKNSPITTVNGTKYQFNSRGDVAKSIDSYGNISEYVWDANHKLNEFKITTNNGWTVLGSRKNGYSEIMETNPRQNKWFFRKKVEKTLLKVKLIRKFIEL